MKQFFKTFFASALGALFAIFVIYILTCIVIASILAIYSVSSSNKKEDSPILKIELSGVIAERESHEPLFMKFFNYGQKKQGLFSKASICCPLPPP
jgi:protease-4